LKLYNADEGDLEELASHLTRVVAALTETKKTLMDLYTVDSKPGFQQWLDQGVKLGYCEEIHCMSHEFPVLNEEETQDFEKGCDTCVPLIRVYLEGDSPCSSI
jgi:hypothetical protein